MNSTDRVLLVEDDAPLRRSLENFLGQAGYAFDTCSTARDALALAEEILPDIVIVEYHLSDANGAALLKKLKCIVPNLATIMISEYDFQSVAKELTPINDCCFLKKPFDLVELEAGLSSARSRVAVASENVDWKREMDLNGMPASVTK